MDQIKKKYYTKRIAIFLLLLFVFSLTGCGRLQSNHEIKAGIRQALPDMVILDIETGKRHNQYKFKEFTIDNKGVVFTYKTEQSKDFFFPVLTIANSDNDYREKLFEYFAQEIADISEKYQVEIEDTGYITNSISDMEEIESGVKALQELYLLMEDYIPKTELDWFPFSLTLWTTYGTSHIITIDKQGDFNYDYAVQFLYMNFRADVDMGLVTDVKLSEELLASIPQKYIHTLYINGKPYQSEKYEISFIYNLEDEKYYALAGFGIENEYNGEGEDYLQEEIIESYYPGAEYSISIKDHKSSYKIGNDLYSVERKKDGLIFMKNNSILNIQSYREISGERSGATYYYWIRVDDFAEIMGMSVDKVEESGVYLRLP